MGFDKRIISSLRTVPPVVTMAPTFMCFAISITIAEVCNASSRVGTRIRATQNKLNRKKLGLYWWNDEREKKNH